MKRLLMIVAAFLLMLPEIQAKPKAHFSFSGTAEIGRKKKDCKQIWICVKDWDIDVRIELGAIKSNNHGIILDEDGTLFLAIESEKVKNQDLEKFRMLESGSIFLDSEETLPREILNALGYTGSNIFKAGTYRVAKVDNYFLIRLN